jgi:MFS family permease
VTLADARSDLVSSRPPGSPWARPYGAVTAGAFGLSFLFAFEALAVATVMPAVARELDGLALYPVAFAAPLAAAVVALVVAGPLADRHGPSPVLHGGLVVFATGVSWPASRGRCPSSCSVASSTVRAAASSASRSTSWSPRPTPLRCVRGCSPC